MNNTFYLFIFLFFVSCSGTQSEKKNTETSNEAVPKSNSAAVQNSATAIKKSTLVPDSEMISFKGGTFIMGSDNGLPQEKPAHEVTVKPFSIDKSPVTVAQFRVFIRRMAN